jgi:DNA-binding MarR family transcriptional regulator
VTDEARELGELFPQVYVRLHRRDGKQPQLAGASRAVLHHLAGAGPLTVGELAAHLDRAQSVASEIVDHLVDDGLLERMRDPKDRRRTLVWLTDAGQQLLERDREVLSRELVTAAMARMTAEERAALITGMRALVRAAEPNRSES